MILNIYAVEEHNDAQPPPPSSSEEDNKCPFCRLRPCIIDRPPPPWLRGNRPPHLGNVAKRYPLYKKFWTLLGQLGVWDDPHYRALKITKTSIDDRRDVMPTCVVRVRYNIIKLYTELKCLGNKKKISQSTRGCICGLSAVVMTILCNLK